MVRAGSELWRDAGAARPAADRRALRRRHRARRHVGQTSSAAQSRTITHVALHPGHRAKNGDNYLDDVAIVRSTSRSRASRRSRSASATRACADHRHRLTVRARHGPQRGRDAHGGGLRQATLRQCLRRRLRGGVYAHNHPGTGERFNAARMRCAVDVDGSEPLSSGCFGDSGGPLVVGPDSAPVQLGVVSWGGDKCGADHSPSVFADVDRYRDFILAASDPVWAPERDEDGDSLGHRPAHVEVLGLWARGRYERR